MSKKNNGKYLVIGDSILDHYLYGRCNRMSPEDSTIPILDIDSEEYRLGGCLNVSVNLKSLSGEDVFVTSIISNKCKKLLDSRKINHQYSYHLVEVEGIKKTRIININDGKQVVRLDNIQKFNKEFIEEYQFLLKCIDFDDFDCIVVSDYQKGIVDDFVVRKLETFEKPVFVDTKNPNLAIWNNVSNCIIKINSNEFDAKHCWPTRPLIITKSEKGCTLEIPIKTRQDKVVIRDFPTIAITDGDVTGAGDVFLAGLASEYMRTKDLPKAIEYANKAATRSVQQKGTVEVYL